MRYEFKCVRCDHNILVVEVPEKFNAPALDKKLRDRAQPRVGLRARPPALTPVEQTMVSTGWTGFAIDADDTTGVAVCPECSSGAAA
jgi:hypothetical protein